MPDRIALNLHVETLAARIQEHFRFVVHRTPAFQLKGFPASTSGPGTRARPVAGHRARRRPPARDHDRRDPYLGPLHLRKPENYFRRRGSGLRRAPPDVRRAPAVERSSPSALPRGGLEESFCHFRSAHRVQGTLRRIEHEFSVLKAVFTPSRLQDMVRVLRRRARASVEARQRRRGGFGPAFLEWLLTTTTS
jgi:hypothetical protein